MKKIALLAGVALLLSATMACSSEGTKSADSKNDSTKYFYIGWFRSGSAPASNYKFVKQYSSNTFIRR